MITTLDLPLVLWDVPESDWQNWRAAHCGSAHSFEDYQFLLETAASIALENGREVALVSATTADVLDCLRTAGLTNTPEHREQAVAELWRIANAS